LSTTATNTRTSDEAVASAPSASHASSASSSSVPIVVINTPQAVRPYNGTTSWSSFKDHFERVARVNKWETNETKAQHLQLALEGAAAETLKELNDGSPSLYQDIWDALKRRFGEVDEARSAMTRFERRRQHDGESVVEFEQGLRALYRVAWPKATDEQKNVALKARFEEGLSNPEMQQYLRLHASTDDFSATVQKARRFASTTEMSKPKKTVRIATPPPSHDTVQMIDGQSSLHEKVDKIESLIRSMQMTTPRAETPPAGGSSDKRVNSGGKSPKPPPVSRPKGEQPRKNNNNGSSPARQSTDGQSSNSQYVRPFDNRQFTPRQWTNSNANYANFGQMPARQRAQSPNPPGAGNPQNSYAARQRDYCWVCGQEGCYSYFHGTRPQTPPSRPRWNSGNRSQTPPARLRWNRNPQQTNPTPFRGNGTCWTCGNVGCRSWFHNDVGRPDMQSGPPLASQSQQENSSGTRPTGNRGPNQPARPASH